MALDSTPNVQPDPSEVKVNGDHVDSHEHNSGETEDQPMVENTFQITVKLPHPPHKTQTIISTQDQAQDIRQSIIDVPHTFQYSCFHLEVNGERIPEFVDLSQVPGIAPGAELSLVEDPYTEKDARMHVLRVRELIGAAGDRTDVFHGMHAGLSLHDNVVQAANGSIVPNGNGQKRAATNDSHAMTSYDPDAPGKFDTLLQPSEDPPPKTLKTICVSPWNPPPYHLRSRGHLLYIQLTTLEGEQYQITSQITGFYVNRSTTAKFDPFPRTSPRAYSAHSLLTLLSMLSPAFKSAFKALQEHSATKDPLASFQLSNAIPASPWVINPTSTLLSTHVPDITRNQESFLISGADNAETLRDWNEEFQTTRELPRETVQDRVFRERVTSKLFADYNEAATVGAVLIARGEVAALNPTEPPDAQIFVYNNVFYSFGADGVGTFANEGGNEAARVATGKDVMGVKTVNQIDIQDLATPGTVIVDFMGKRIVCQSIVPGIFKQREPGEQQIDYGGVEGKDVVADNEVFAPLFEKLSKALHVKKHPVWDKESKRHDLEASIETKGLLGTDGRKYALDLYRITPVDVHWLETHWTPHAETSDDAIGTQRYPHRMTVFRSELVDAYWRLKLREYVRNELARKASSKATKAVQNGEEPPSSDQEAEKSTSEAEVPVDGEGAVLEEQHAKEDDAERVDISGFTYAFNPDVFSGQQPQNEEERAEWEKDKKEVRALSEHLLGEVMPRFIQDLQEGDVGFPMDGQSLSSLLHKRGINIRYLGKTAELADRPEPRLIALKELCQQEMISRSFKHIVNRYLQQLPAPFTTCCISHLLNCLLGAVVSKQPVAQIDRELRAMYSTEKFEFENLDPEGIQEEIKSQVSLRYRYELPMGWVDQMKPVQMLREVALKIGLQLAAREYQLGDDQKQTNGVVVEVNGDQEAPAENGHASKGGKRKNHKTDNNSPNRDVRSQHPIPTQTFNPDDIYNMLPVIKEASPRSVLADEALEAGRISMAQNQRELGQELLLESLSLHEQIYGILHPEVARVYYQLSSFFYSLDDKPIAVELARKAVIVSERTLGLDSHETVLAYLNLGLFEHAVGNTHLALSYVRHALDLWKIVYGPNHPDSITTMNNAAVMLQHLKLYHDSRLWFEASLAISNRVSGPTSVNTATLLFQLAQALALDQDSKAAVARMREAYNIFHAELGPNDRNTKEAETWLEQLTQNAVSIAKHAKDVQARRLRRFNHLTPRVTLGMRPQPPAGQSERETQELSVAGAGMGRTRGGSLALDERSIDELLKYIDGGEGAKTSSPRKKQTNPKRRQQRA